MAFRTQKISQMTPKGSDLEATDLIEVSTIESGSYVTRSITGQEIIDAIPVPPSGITIGSTAIASGVVGRVLFEGTGNVVSESAGLTYNDTTKAFTLSGNQNTPTVLNVSNTTSGTAANAILRLTSDSGAGYYDIFKLSTTFTTYKTLVAKDAGFYNTASGGDFSFLNDNASGRFKIAVGASSTAQFIVQSTGNVGIGTTTDAGFRLDVNGTARVQGNITSTSSGLLTHSFFGGTGYYALIGTSSASGQYAEIYRPTSTKTLSINNGDFDLNLGVKFNYTGLFGILIKGATGNVLINTTTDAGFRLDVNGTARFQSDVTVANSLMKMYVTGGVIRFEQQGGAGLPIGFMQNGSFYQYIDQATLNIAFRNDYSFVMTTGNTSTINASAKMQIDSTTRGFLPPRMTTTQKNAIASPAAGLMVYDTTLNVISYYNGTMWI